MPALPWKRICARASRPASLCSTTNRRSTRNRLTGAEALIRWKHPWRNILPPGEFIPLAEETGLILPLGKWVLEAACAQIAAWSERRQSARLSISVNISARQFHQPDFVEQVWARLTRSGADPRNLKPRAHRKHAG
jgi:EAL domain-containing protein (putative c-di-GMP-specific phosphodiesterase class I)